MFWNNKEYKAVIDLEIIADEDYVKIEGPHDNDRFSPPKGVGVSFKFSWGSHQEYQEGYLFVHSRKDGVKTRVAIILESRAETEQYDATLREDGRSEKMRLYDRAKEVAELLKSRWGARGVKNLITKVD